MEGDKLQEDKRLHGRRGREEQRGKTEGRWDKTTSGQNWRKTTEDTTAKLSTANMYAHHRNSTQRSAQQISTITQHTV